MSSSNDEVITLSNGEVTIWISEESSLHIKCVTKHGDPVEFNSDEIDELCQILKQLADRIR